MKRKLIVILLLLSPFLSFAQEEGAVVKDFCKGVRGINTSFSLNDHVNIVQILSDNENFDIAAVNDQMQTLWKTSLKGYVVSTSKFKDKILAVAATEYSSTKLSNNTFKGYIIDPSNGKVLLEKIIFDGNQNYLSFPYVFTGDGSFFKFCLRQSACERRIHVGIALISENSWIKQLKTTRDMDIIDFDEKLDPVYKLKPVLPNGVFLNIACNNNGDTFIGRYNSGNIVIEKYDAGKNSPSTEQTLDITLDDDVLSSDIPMESSKKNKNVLYYALTFKNANKEIELGVGKLDFTTGKKQYTSEIFTKDHVKELKKNFTPANKKLDSPDLGDRSTLKVRVLNEIDDHIIVSLASTVSQRGNYSSSTIEYSTLINNFDINLNLRHQYLIPTSCLPLEHSNNEFHYDKNKLFVITNNLHGLASVNAVYSVFDLNNGQCEKMEILSKKKIGNSDLAAAFSIFWFKDNFIAPYLDRKGFSGVKYDIALQQDNY